MSNINIFREHDLGLEKAREIARKWQADGEAKLSLVCDYSESDHGDVLAFKRSGVKGELKITENSFQLDAKLGLVARPFKEKIISGANKSLDKLLAKG